MASIFHLGRVDLTNAVLVAMLLNLTIGLFLAIYTGVVVTNYMTFRNAIAQVASELTQISLTLIKSGQAGAGVALANFGADARARLISLHQMRASDALQSIRIRVRRAYEVGLGKSFGELRKDDEWKSASPIVRWESVIFNTTRRLRSEDEKALEDLFEIRPSIRTLLIPPQEWEWFRQSAPGAALRFVLVPFAIAGKLARWIDSRYAPRRSECRECRQQCCNSQTH